MFIVTLTTREFGTQYVSGTQGLSYPHISEVTSSPVRRHAIRFATRVEAEQAAVAANAYNDRGLKSHAQIEETEEQGVVYGR